MADWYADAHSDIPSSVLRERDRGRDRVIAADFLDGMRAGGIGFRVMATIVDDDYLPELGLRRGLDAFVATRREVATTDALTLATTAEDVLAAGSPDPVTVLLSLEGVEPLAGDLAMLDVFYELGLRLVTLTHSRRNAAGDGSFYAPRPAGEPGGITDFGVEVVRRLEELGVVIDVSHLNEPGFWDVLEFADGPIIASHSNCRERVDHPRNLSDEAVEAVADTGGVVGVMAIDDFLTPPGTRASIEDYLDHVERLVDRVGVQHVCLGFDFFDYLADYRPTWDRDDLPFGGMPAGLREDADVAAVGPALRDRGFDDDAVGAITHGNLRRVIADALEVE